MIAMCKSSVPVFVLLFAFLFRLETPSVTLVLIMLMICFGVTMTVVDEVSGSFHLLGLTQVMFASFFSGLRWCLVQLLLSKESIHPLTVNALLTPFSSVVLFVVASFSEGLGELFGSSFYATWSSSFITLLLQACGGVLAFCLMMSEVCLG